MRFLAVPALALMALTTTAHAQTALTPKTLAVLDVLSGGTISNPVGGRTVNVASGGTASSPTILGGGFETISAGGDTSALISVGGYQLIGAGGEATSTTVAWLTMKSLTLAALITLSTTSAAAIECERKGDMCVIKLQCPPNHIHFEGKCWTNKSFDALQPAIYDKPFTVTLITGYTPGP